MYETSICLRTDRCWYRMIKRPHTYRYCQGIPHLPSATHLRCQGSCPGSYSFLQAIPIYQAVPTAQHATTRCELLKFPCFHPNLFENISCSCVCHTKTNTHISIGPRKPPNQSRAQEAWRPLRVHSMRLLQHFLPLVLVEPRRVPWPGCAAPILPMDCRLAWWEDGWATGCS